MTEPGAVGEVSWPIVPSAATTVCCMGPAFCLVISVSCNDSADGSPAGFDIFSTPSPPATANVKTRKLKLVGTTRNPLPRDYRIASSDSFLRFADSWIIHRMTAAAPASCGEMPHGSKQNRQRLFAGVAGRCHGDELSTTKRRRRPPSFSAAAAACGSAAAGAAPWERLGSACSAFQRSHSPCSSVDACPGSAAARILRFAEVGGEVVELGRLRAAAGDEQLVVAVADRPLVTEPPVEGVSCGFAAWRSRSGTAGRSTPSSFAVRGDCRRRRRRSPSAGCRAGSPGVVGLARRGRSLPLDHERDPHTLPRWSP